MPLTERQQMAFLLEMTAKEFKEKKDKKNEAKKLDEESEKTAEKLKINKRNKRGETQLHLASIKGDIGTVKSLISKGADVNVTDYAGWTPLHESCSRGHYEIVKILLKAGANVNAKGLEDDTPLHDASSNGHVKVVRILLKYGADALRKNDDLDTPIDVAAEPEISDLLETYSSLTDAERENYCMSGDFLSDVELEDDFCSLKSTDQEPDECSNYDIKQQADVEDLKNEIVEVEAIVKEKALKPSVDDHEENQDTQNQFRHLEEDDDIDFVPRKRRRHVSSSKRICTDDEDDSITVDNNTNEAGGNAANASDSDVNSIQTQSTKENNSVDYVENLSVKRIKDIAEKSKVKKIKKFIKADRKNTTLLIERNKSSKEKKLKSLSERESVHRKRVKRFKSMLLSDSSFADTEKNKKERKTFKSKQIKREEDEGNSCDANRTEIVARDQLGTSNSDDAPSDSRDCIKKEEQDEEDDSAKKTDENYANLSQSDDMTAQSSSVLNDNPYISDISDVEIDGDKLQQDKLTSDMFCANIFTNVLEQAADSSTSVDNHSEIEQSSKAKFTADDSASRNDNEIEDAASLCLERDHKEDSVTIIDKISNKGNVSPSVCSAANMVKLEEQDQSQGSGLSTADMSKLPNDDMPEDILDIDMSSNKQVNSAQMLIGDAEAKQVCLSPHPDEKAPEEEEKEPETIPPVIQNNTDKTKCEYDKSTTLVTAHTLQSNEADEDENIAHVLVPTDTESDVDVDDEKSALNSTNESFIERAKGDFDCTSNLLTPAANDDHIPMSDSAMPEYIDAGKEVVNEETNIETENYSCSRSVNEQNENGADDNCVNSSSDIPKVVAISQISSSISDDLKPSSEAQSQTACTSVSSSVGEQKESKLLSDALNNNNISIISTSEENLSDISSPGMVPNTTETISEGNSEKEQVDKISEMSMGNNCAKFNQTQTDEEAVAAVQANELSTDEDNVQNKNSSTDEEKGLKVLKTNTFCDETSDEVGDSINENTNDNDTAMLTTDVGLIDASNEKLEAEPSNGEGKKHLQEDDREKTSQKCSSDVVMGCETTPGHSGRPDDAVSEPECTGRQREESNLNNTLDGSKDHHEVDKLTVKDGVVQYEDTHGHLGPFHGTKFEETNIDLKGLHQTENAMNSLRNTLNETNSKLALAENKEESFSVIANDIDKNIKRFNRTYLTELSEEDKHIVNMSMEIAENMNCMSDTEMQSDAYIAESVSESTGINNKCEALLPGQSNTIAHAELSADIEETLQTPTQNQLGCNILSGIKDQDIGIGPEGSNLMEAGKHDEASQDVHPELVDKSDSSVSTPLFDSSFIPYPGQSDLNKDDGDFNTSRTVTASRTRTVDIEPRGIAPVVIGLDLSSIEHRAIPSNEAASSNTISINNGDVAMETEGAAKENDTSPVEDEMSEGFMNKPDTAKIYTESENGKPIAVKASHPTGWRKALMRKHAILKPQLLKYFKSFSLITGKYHLLTDQNEESSDMDTSDSDEINALKEEHLVELEKLHLCMEQELLRVENIVQSAHNKMSPVGSCGVVLYQNLEQYAKLNSHHVLNQSTASDVTCTDELRKSLIQQLLDKFSKLEERMISRHKQELLCLEKQQDSQKLNQLGRKEILRRRYLAVHCTGNRSFTFSS